MIEILNELVENSFRQRSRDKHGIIYGGNSYIGFYRDNIIFLHCGYHVCWRIFEQIYEFEKRGIQLLFSLQGQIDNDSLYYLDYDIKSKKSNDLSSDKLNKLLSDNINHYNINQEQINEYPRIANILKIGNRDKIIGEIL